jgi:Predicted metal-binding protein
MIRLSPKGAALAVLLAGGALGGWAGVSHFAPATGKPPPAKTMDVWKSETCGCCADWISYMEGHGYTVTIHDVDDVDPVKDRLQVPAEARSCHTARIGALVVEGHVPVEAIERVLALAPEGVAGIAAPGMPEGAPGMDVTDEPFPVVTFGEGGVTLLGQY